MARVIRQSEAKRLGLPGRVSLEVVSHEVGSQSITFRIAEIPVPPPGEKPRAPHVHKDFEECIFVLQGEGTTHADSGEYPLKQGDTILVPPGEKHATRNTGTVPLILLCFFPVADITKGSQEGQALTDKK